MRIWIAKYAKRFLRQPLFLVLLFLMPVGTFVFSYMAHQETTAVIVGVCCGESGGMGGEIVDGLLEHEGIFRFVRYDSRKKMVKDVVRGDISCGYYFPAGIEDKIKAHDYEGLVKQYYRRNVSARIMVSETIFAALFKECGREQIIRYVMGSGLYDTVRLGEQTVAGVFQKNYETQRTFQMDYEDSPVRRTLGDYLTAPMTGIAALLIFLAGFCGVIQWNGDERRGLLMAAPAGISPRLSWICTAVPPVILSAAGIPVLFIAQAPDSFSWKEIACLAVYDIMVVGFAHCFAGRGISDWILWGIALAAVFASAIATPVFIRLETVIPWIGALGWLCPPAYFLRALYGGVGSFAGMAAVAAALVAAGVFRQKRKAAGR